jgi:hypothetical protein
MTDTSRVTVDEAAHEVKLASRRIALLHLAFCRAAIKTLGEDAGRRLVIDAIRTFGIMIGTEVRDAVARQGLEPVPENYGMGDSRSLPKFGMHAGKETITIDGKERIRSYGCALAEVWAEYGEMDLGRLYCYVDPAKYMSFNPKYTKSHSKALPSGDPFCEFCVRETTAKERADFASDTADWTHVDCCDPCEAD